MSARIKQASGALLRLRRPLDSDAVTLWLGALTAMSLVVVAGAVGLAGL